MSLFSFAAGERAHLRDAALQAAFRLGVFAALDEPRSCEALARAIGVAPRRLGALLDVLVFEGVLLCAEPGARFALDRMPVPPPALPAAGWGLLAEVIRADAPVDEAGISGAGSEALCRFHAHLFKEGAAAARALASRIGPSLPPSLLDAGGGAGAYTQAFLEAQGELTATLVDRPAVVALARSALAPRAARVRFVEGEIETAPLGEGHGVALLCNVLHLHGPITCARLVARAAAALAPGGRLVVEDFFIAADRRGPPSALHFALNMALYTPEGTVHPPGRIMEWLAAAGLVAIEWEARDEETLVVWGRRPDERAARRGVLPNVVPEA